MATVRPLGDRVLVKEIPRERITTGGVILPDQARQQADRGLVVAVGPGSPEPVAVGSLHVSDMRAVPVSVDEVVLFSPYAGSKVSVADDDFLLLREHDILGILDGVEVVRDEETAELRLREPEAVSR